MSALPSFSAAPANRAANPDAIRESPFPTPE
jgi:hypothetical protein